MPSMPERHSKDCKVSVGSDAAAHRREIRLDFSATDARVSRAKIRPCPLLSKSGQMRARLECPLCAKSGQGDLFQPLKNFFAYGRIVLRDLHNRSVFAD